ncbi:MAG: hypothetical protein HY074_13085 [Deltaproteobacteria bacterium]|nr:hypothetical protein [Deltaproteobacteria bacterium]
MSGSMTSRFLQRFLFVAAVGVTLNMPLAYAGSKALPPPDPAAAHCARYLVDEMHEVLKEGRYENFRGLEDYRGLLGDWFLKHLYGLGRFARWIDMGAGHGRAQREYLADKSNLAKNVVLGKAKTLAVAYEQPVFRDKAALYDSTLPTPKRHQKLIGRFVEDIPDAELGKADLITDVYGALSYTDRLDEVLNKYLRILNDGGAIYFYTESLRTKIWRKDGTVLYLYEWLQTLQGLRVETDLRGYRITKTSPDAQVPQLKLIGGYASKPPARIFKEQ